MCCCRDDLLPITWHYDEGAIPQMVWMGLPPDYAHEGTRHDWQHPAESFDDGCPGGWYRCQFVHSLDPYLPTPSGQGLMESPLVGPGSPRLILEAVQMYKRERAAADAHYFNLVTST